MVEAVDILVRRAGEADRAVSLPVGVAQVGRAVDCEVVLSDVSVSRRHARIVVRADGVRVEDVGSGNGIYFRGYAVQSHTVEDGDQLTMGPFTLQFSLRGVPRTLDGEPTATPRIVPLARLEVVAGTGLARRVFLAGPGGLTIGRSDAREVVLADPSASRHHASLVQTRGGWLIRDEQSANGIYVNGARVREVAVRDGDRIRIGSTEFRFMTGDPSTTDSNTQRAIPELFLPEPEVSEHTPPIVLDAETPVDAPERAARPQRSWVLPVVLVTATSLVFMAAGIAAVVAWVWFQPVATSSPETPRWSLAVSPPATGADPAGLQERSARALRGGDSREALASVYQALLVDPGRSAAERLAFAAGEHLVLDRLERTFDKAERLDGSGVASLAPSARMAEELRWTDAARSYRQALRAPLDDAAQIVAFEGLNAAQREVAREVETQWREAHVARVRGRPAEARQRFENVLAVDPDNAAARHWLRRLAPVSPAPEGS